VDVGTRCDWITAIGRDSSHYDHFDRWYIEDMPKPWVIGVVAFIAGAVTASGAWTAFPPSKAPAPASSALPEPSKDESALEKANANLTASLHECDRRLAELGERPVGTASPVASAPAPEGSTPRRRERGAMSKEDWERMAENGVVPVRVPCIRDKPWAPTERTVDRLGLAPSDVDVLKAAYEASNKRMSDQLRPLCEKTLGSADAVDKVGLSSCIDVINRSAVKGGADTTKAALSRVAEVQAGKREAPKAGADVAPVEALGLILTKESKTFEDDLAQKLGPEEARRLASAPELCTERKMLRSGDLDTAFGGGGGRRNRNR
jgi:hypothetical protein